ncbi:MAG: DUF1566 domain-containing protein [Desulfamplus sp.]|nr:DUF1566 domain-containing protein [Desulfamplus sp.]
MKIRYLFLSVSFWLVFAANTSFAATWPVPDTGITKCYNNSSEIPCPSPGEPFYGQDGNYSINPMSYTKLDSSGNDLPITATEWTMVRDNVTGLIWENKNSMDGKGDYTNPHDADNIYTWYDSNSATNGGDAGTAGDGTDTEDFIKSLNNSKYGGYSDWRLPTMKELGTIIDYSSIQVSGPAVKTDFFPDTISNFYWSNTTYLNNTGNAWGINFSESADRYYIKNNPAYVRAVRGGEATPYLTVAIDGIIIDLTTGLMWEQATGDNGNMMIWEEALDYCENLTLGGHADWRLPTVKELRTIVDYTRKSPAINKDIFFDAETSFYWSSTTDSTNTANIWGIYFVSGVGISGVKDNISHVRAVRGGDTGTLLDNWVMEVSPVSQNVSKDAGTTSFDVSNAGTDTMNWTAQILSYSDWIQINSGSEGNNAGTVSCSFDANDSASERTATIRITPEGSDVSPMDVTVTQAAGGSLLTVTTGNAFSVSENSATLTGTVQTSNSNGFAEAYYYFEYGTTTAYGFSSSQILIPTGVTSTVTSESDIADLTESTAYHFRLVVIDASGINYGSDRTFTTTDSAGDSSEQWTITDNSGKRIRFEITKDSDGNFLYGGLSAIERGARTVTPKVTLCPLLSLRV